MGTRFVLAITVLLCVVAIRTDAQSPQSARPLGTWERTVGPYHLSMQVEADRLHGTLTLSDKSEKLTIQLDADYSVTRDSILYGVVTDFETTPSPVDGRQDMTLLYIDQPFSFRFRVDGDSLIIRDVKFMNTRAKPEGDLKEVQIIVGRYKLKKAAATKSEISAVPTPPTADPLIATTPEPLPPPAPSKKD